MIRTRCLGAALLALFAAACAEPVKDIDRTQGNLLRKADLAGEWYVLETIVDVPPTTWFTFIGETGRMERVRWEIQKDLLVAYRSYALLPGADAPATNQPRDANDNPVAAWAILEHVDVIRDYNSETGEQSNVILEDSQDRLWFEREFVRVDWSRNLVPNFDFIAPTSDVTSVGYFVEEEQKGADAFYREENDDGLHYFDVTGKLFVQPDEEACYLTWWGLGAYDCTSAEILTRTSFARVPAQPTYEPFHYDDQLLSRFGFFRSERFGYDPRRGVVDAARRYMIQRHHIWEASVGTDGKPIPVPDRKVRTVPYYLSPTFPDDSALFDAAKETMRQWDDAAKRGVAAAQGKPVSADTHVFVLCSNPVKAGENPACGEEGTARRMGDLRYSTLHWVDPHTSEGLLGYGPSAADPVTGEIIAGKAYVYGAAVNEWATSAVDIIRYFNGDLDESLLIHGKHFHDEVRERVVAMSDRPPADEALDRVPLRKPLRPRERAQRPSQSPRDMKPFDPARIERRLDAAREAGQSPMLMNKEVKRALSAVGGGTWESLDPEVRDRLDPTRVLNPAALKRVRDLRAKARARNADLRDLIEPSIEGIVRKYAGYTNYDELWLEIRAELFAAVAEHEVGHTLGLRHNFAGSYDSLNYFDEYWDLRAENLNEARTVGDVYRQAELTEAQKDGSMRQYQYSSIMDYGYTWFNDLHGIGKYDEAALIFGYTAGSYEASGSRCDKYPSVESGSGCLANLPGFVEVFGKPRDELNAESPSPGQPNAGELLTRVEDGYTYDDSGLPSINILERVHYTRVAQGFPSLDDLTKGRRLMPYADFVEARDSGAEDRPVRVPYLFCSDEWAEGLLSCNLFDQGADPFEMTRSRIDDYRAYYWFVNFRRDQVDFDVWYPLFDYTYQIFLPLSDYFQDWYLAPYGYDDLFDRTYEMAINAGFDLFAEALATPSYGTYCEGANGRLVHLSEEVLTQGQIDDDDRCAADGRRVDIPAGEGRRPFSFYDAATGYYFEWKPLEAGHYWATLAAMWSLLDPEARIIGIEGDAGVFAISYYDWFADEVDALLNGLLVKNYEGFAPRALLSGDGDDVSATLVYPSATPLFTDEGSFDAETGEKVDTSAWTGGSAGLCDPCENATECAGFTGHLGGVYCEEIDGDRYCLQDCTNDETLCADGTRCEGGNCVPAQGTCAALAAECDAEHPRGSCGAGLTCVGGRCVVPPPLVESEPTFMLATDILWYGMLLTTASYSTRFNDQINVFREGNDSQLEVDPRFSEKHTFTDPMRGTTYAAVQPRCDGPESLGGSVGLCGECEADAECAGATGALGGVYCQPIEEDGPTFCLQDCTNDAAACSAGETCDDAGNCVPAGGTCEDLEVACDADHPHGRCPKDQTCVRGECVAPIEPSARCRHFGPRDTGAVQLVKYGAKLSADYEAALDAWYSFTEDDEEMDNRLARAYFRAQFELATHLDLLETVVATYQIFGRVY